MKRWVILWAALILLAGCGGAESQPNTEPALYKTEIRGNVQALPSEYEEGSGGAIYRNAAFGFGCVLNENWICADEETLTARQNAARAATDSAEQGGFVVDFYASAADESALVEVIVENMGVLYGAIWDETQYRKHSLERIEDALSVYGVQYGAAEPLDIRLTGQERPAILVTGSIGDVPMYQRQVYIKHGDYMAILSVTCFQIDISDAILALFFAVE